MTEQDPQKMHLNKRLEAIAWGLFLIMIGALWLLPDETVPEGTWLLGVGVILLGLNFFTQSQRELHLTKFNMPPWYRS